MNRRDFMCIGGAVGMSSFGLPSFSFSKENLPKGEKSIIWIWLGGGAAVPEMFQSKEDSPIEYRSTTGTIHTDVEGMNFGGHFEKLAKHAKDITVVNSFMHNNNDHDRATHYVMTGYYQGNSNEQKAPSFGSLASSMLGPINSNGLPVYMVDGRINADKAAYLGSAFQPFDINSGSAKNFGSQVEKERLLVRGNLLNHIDRFHKDREEINNLTKIKNQAIDIVLGKASQAFDLTLENSKIKEFYGEGLGQKFLLARRLVQFGVRFVSINIGGWDMHQNIKAGMDNLNPSLDHALSTLLTDLKATGMIDSTMIVVTSEFGRTPKINKDAGRDHYANVNNLLIAGGGYQHGRTIGSTDNKIAEVKDNPLQPINLLRQIMDYYEIPLGTQKTNRDGRPMYLLEGKSEVKPILT